MMQLLPQTLLPPLLLHRQTTVVAFFSNMGASTVEKSTPASPSSPTRVVRSRKKLVAVRPGTANDIPVAPVGPVAARVARVKKVETVKVAETPVKESTEVEQKATEVEKKPQVKKQTIDKEKQKREEEIRRQEEEEAKRKREEEQRKKEEEEYQSSIEGRITALKKKREAKMNELEGLREEQLKVSEAICSTYQEICEIHKKKQKAEEEQTQAAIEENFERAEELDIQLFEFTKEANALTEAALNKGKEWIALESKKAELWKLLERMERESISKLESLKEDQQENILQSTGALKLEQQDGELRIGTEERSIDKKVNRILVDLSSLKEKRDCIQGIIDERTTEQRSHKEEWLSKRQKVRAEIDELLAILEQKKKIERECDSQIAAIEEDITTVAARYGKDLEEVLANIENLDDAKLMHENKLKEVEKEKIEWHAKLQKLQEKVEKEKETLQLIDTLSDLSVKKIEQARSFGLSSVQDATKKEESLQEQLKEHHEIQQLWNSIDSQREEIAGLSAKTFALSCVLSHLESTVSTIKESKLPILTADKKAAVLARNFRQAKSIQQEIKTLEDQLTELDADKEQKEKELKEAKALSDTLQADYDNAIEQVRQRENAADMKKVASLIENIYQLRVEIRDLEFKFSKKKSQSSDVDEDNFDKFILRSKKIELEANRSRLNALRIKWNLEATPEAPIEDRVEKEEETENKPETEAETKTEAEAEAETETETEAEGTEAQEVEVKTENSETGSLFSGLSTGEEVAVVNEDVELSSCSEQAGSQSLSEEEVEAEEEKAEGDEVEAGAVDDTEQKKEEAIQRRTAFEEDLQTTMVNIQVLEEEMLALVEKADLGDEEIERCETLQNSIDEGKENIIRLASQIDQETKLIDSLTH
eukprot:TRINITY_DN104_c1_g1_i1.p1 TRINITY_DN104_c1_g1~~TRINITY_DN104_c1_g1_i1.p1  ORF type:complete len:883 (+),score=343.14 TRINITY_DN104_c1_g1_i1:587-3235(+)